MPRPVKGSGTCRPDQDRRDARHLSEQYPTSAQFFSHFLRQKNGLAQVAQILCGRPDFLIILAIPGPRNDQSMNSSCAGDVDKVRLVAPCRRCPVIGRPALRLPCFLAI